MALPVFNYALMEILCKELQERVTQLSVINCLPHDLHRFFFILRGSQHQEALFFCFAPPFLRFHLVHPNAIPHSHSTHPLLSFLQNATLISVSLPQQDRILKFTFSTSHGERWLIAEFFSKHPNYYLVKPDGEILFALHPLPCTHYHFPPSRSLISETSQWKTHQEVEQAYAEIEKQWKLTQEKQALQKQLSQQLKKLKKKERELLENLQQCSQWATIQHEGDLIKSNFALMKKGISSLRVHDWITDQLYSLTLDPTKTPQEEMAARFKQAKKLQAGQAPLTQHLERTQHALRSMELLQQKLNPLKTAEELATFKASLPPALIQTPPSVSQAKLPAPIYREYTSAKGIKIWAGKSAKDNDRLTFQLANGRDWWLHIKGSSGSHVIIRMNKEQEPDSETLKDALQLALYYSKARNQGEGEVCFTQRKYVSRLGKNKAGRVQISKHQTAWIRFDPARFQALKDRS